MSKHIAKIEIANSYLLKMLDFEGGYICDIRPSDHFGSFEILLEHPDLPLTNEGSLLLNIVPAMTITYAEQGGIIKVERTYPPKTSQEEQPCQTTKPQNSM